MVDFIPPLELTIPPAPLSPNVPLNPPMVGIASPFDHVDGQNRDLIIEAIRQWSRGPLRDWTTNWQEYLIAWMGGIRDWLGTWDDAVVAYVTDSLNAQDAQNDIKIADLTAYVGEQITSMQAALDEAIENVITGSIEVSDPVIVGVLTNAASATRAFLNTHYAALDTLDNAIMVLSGPRYPDIVPFTGNVSAAADVAPAINAALATIPRGATVKLAPGRYCIRTTINLTRGITFLNDGVEFVIDAAVPVFTATGSYETTYPVNTITEDRTILESGDRQWTQVVVVGAEIAEGWKRGDIVRMVANDVIPGGRPGKGVAVAGVTATAAAATDLFTSSAAHTLVPGDGVYLDTPAPSGLTSGVYDKQRYFVKTVPSATTFTIARTIGGATVDVLLDTTFTGIRKSTAESRVGQFFDVLSISNGVGLATVTLSGRLLDPMTTGIRIARMVTDERFKIVGGTYDRSDAIITAGTVGQIIRFDTAYRPVLRDLDIRRNNGPTVIMYGCYGWTIDNLKTGWSLNDSAVSFGYAVLDNQGAYGTFKDSTVYAARHSYSDDTVRILAGDVKLASYGRSYANRIHHVEAVNCTSSAFDTHHCAQEIQFRDVVAIGGPSFAMGLRGRKHTVRGLTSLDSRAGLNIFTENGGGDSWGHDISDVSVSGYIAEALQVSINTGSAGDNPGELWGVRESRARKTKIRNYRATDPQLIPTTGASVARIQNLENAEIVVEDFRADSPTVVAADYDLITPLNAGVSGRNWVFDFAANTAGNNMDVIHTAGNNRLDIDGVRVLAPVAGFAGRLGRVFNTTTTDLLRVERCVLDENPASGVNASVAAGSYIDYRVLATAESSDFDLITDATYNDAAAGWIVRAGRTHRNRVLESSLTVDGTIPALPVGLRYGQKLDIVHSGAGTLRIVHGSGGRTLLFGNVNAALAQFGHVSLVWSPTSGGRWRQIA